MAIRDTLAGIVLTGIGLVGLTGCADSPKLSSSEDITGDGVGDIEIRASNGGGNVHDMRDYVFIGDGKGGFIRSEKKETEDGMKYLLTDDGKHYPWDGQFYRLQIEKKLDK